MKHIRYDSKVIFLLDYNHLKYVCGCYTCYIIERPKVLFLRRGKNPEDLEKNPHSHAENT